MEKVHSIAGSRLPLPGALEKPREASRLPVYACGLVLWTQVARIQEIVPGLHGLRPSISSLLLAAALCVLSGRIADGRALRSVESRRVLLFWILATLSVPFSVWRGGAYNFWLYTITFNTIFFFCILLGTRTRRELSSLWSAVVVSAGILTVGAFISPSSGGRVAATAAYDPNDFAFVLLCLLPLVLGRFAVMRGVRRLLLAALMVLMLILVLQTQSRGGFVGLLILGAFFLFSSASGIRGGRRLAICVLAGVIIFLQSPEALWTRLSELLTGQDYNLQSDLATGRLVIWKRGLVELFNNPVLGVGAGQFPTAMGQQYGRQAWLVSHNSFLQVGVELGLIALLVYVSILFRVGKNVRAACCAQERETRALAAGVRQSVVVFAVGGLFLSQAYSPIFWLLLCFSYRLNQRSGED